MKEFVEYVVRGLVDAPDEVRVEERVEDGADVCEIHCHPDDIGKVIGKSGRTISAIRMLAGGVAARTGTRAVIDLVEASGPDAD